MAFLDRPEGQMVVALGVGLVIGAERERRKSETRVEGAAGIRTFALVALLGVALAMLDNRALLVAGFLVVGSLAALGYMRDRSDPGLTTEMALLLTFGLGALAHWQPKLALAAGLSAATLLAFRAHLHSAVKSVLNAQELQDALLFGMAALVILPLLPNQPIGPLGMVNPFTLWRLVVLTMGLSGAGYIAQRVIGPRYGLALAGFGSGFVSSAATIAAMAQRSRGHAELVGPAAAGAAASTVATFVLMAVMVGVANLPLLAALGWPLIAGGLTALGYAIFLMWRARRAQADPSRGHAFKLSTALLFALIVATTALVSTLAKRWLGPAGAIATAAVAGFADAHAAGAAIASVAAADQISPAGAEMAILLVLTTNSVTKTIVALVSGGRHSGFAIRVILGLGLVLAATWITAALTLLR